jgi:hypothetical protein
MRSYLAVIALAICICAVSSRSLRPYLNEDDESNGLQQEINRRTINQALLLNRLRKLFDSDEEITNVRDIQSQSDESSDQDDVANTDRRSDDSNSVELARKKRQLFDADDDHDHNNNGGNDESDSDESGEESDGQNQIFDNVKYSDEVNEDQGNNNVKYNDVEEESNDPNTVVADDDDE